MMKLNNKNATLCHPHALVSLISCTSVSSGSCFLLPENNINVRHSNDCNEYWNEFQWFKEKSAFKNLHRMSSGCHIFPY